LAGELVLIVDDNEKNLELVRDLLQVTGYRTLEAGNAADCIVLAAKHRPDLILMDVHLPDDDGVAALGRLRAMPGVSLTTVVALTAFAMRGDRERLLAAGFDGYLSKPIEIQPFLHQVRRFCTRET
jgi:two-component system cell cycle response regulator DivK